MEVYKNYERIIQTSLEESLSKIINKITDNSVVFDVGCSAGMLGKYLSEKKGCVVDGVDIDKAAIELCRPIYRQVVAKNLEVDSLTDVFKLEEYDFIVVADVIEHIVNPDNFLSELRKLIKPTGTIIFSVPNVTHIASGFELLLGNFKYSPNGLLDNTHLRFYSKQSLLDKLESFELYAWEIDTVQKEISETEFSEHISKLFPEHWTEELVAYREDALTYQWLVSTRTILNNSELATKTAQLNERKLPLLFTTTLFWTDKEDVDFTEEKQLLGQLVTKKEGVSLIEFHISESSNISSAIEQIRIDPVSDQKPFLIVKAEILDTTHDVIWAWNPNNSTDEFHGAVLVERMDSIGSLFQSTNNDPQWHPHIDKEILSKLGVGYTIRVSLIMDDPLIYLYHNELINRDVIESDGQIVSLNQAVADRDGQIVSLNQTVAELDGQIVSLNQTVAELDGQIVNLVAVQKHIFSSISWKITKPLRFFGRNFVNPLYFSVRQIFSHGIRQLWFNLPLPNQQKQLFKNKLFSHLPIAFKWSQAYRSWYAMNRASAATYGLPAYQTSQHEFKQSVSEYVPLLYALPPKDVPVRLIAFYLPQFHVIAENDQWWGEGFTEWANVMPAQPQFEGHYQPHVPNELGYYNLLDSSTQLRQIELAKLHGVGGFCFYTYWFAGKLLLEKPIENYLSDSALDFPFCLCWANENWSRRWDGLDNDILMAQKHSPDDDLAFIEHVSQYMKDARYIRIDGKPLLLVYRPSLLPSARETAKRWRDWCLSNGIGEIYLAYTQSFETVDPIKYGFDAAIEFPPNNSAPPNITNTVKPLNTDFSGTVYDWDVFVERSRGYSKPAYKLFRSVCPAWDNTARRKAGGTVFLNSTPQKYQEWLTNAVVETCTRIENLDERLIFVNAWNEWAEGAHLEPDQHYGYAYLDATRKALLNDVDGNQKKIIVVTHDAHPHGAQYLALNIAKELSQGFSLNVDIVCLGAGELKNQYAQYGNFHDLNGLNHRGSIAQALAKKLAAAGHRFAIVNTTVSGFFLETLSNHGIKCISLIHEQRGVLDQLSIHKQAQTISRLASKVIFAAQQVADEFQEIAPVSDIQRALRPQGLYKKITIANRDAAQLSLRKNLQLPAEALIVLGVGYADYRKGIDLFVESGKILVSQKSNVYMVWLGHWDAEMQEYVQHSLAGNTQIKSHFIFPGRRDETDLFYAGANVYALTSREDPFPSVVLEAMDASLPVVGFEGAGGCSELFVAGSGKLVPAFDINAYSSALYEILENPALAKQMGQIGHTQVRERFSFRHYLFDLLKLLEYPLARVSVVVPNYNYAQYLSERIKTIEEQDFPVYELIILDDCSQDNSLDIIENIIHNSKINIIFERNNSNSGSVFAQWQKGVQLATGDLIWIAEADDLSKPDFLTSVLRGFDNTKVVMSYCESKQITPEGKVLCDNYLDYVADIGRERWQTSYICDGNNEIINALSVKNTIPNVSAVVFQRKILNDVLQQEQIKVREFTVAGDWYVYTKVLERGQIAFIPYSANLHRRHSKSVTNASLNLSQLEEIVRMQHMVASTHSVSNAMQKAAKSYAQKLYVQLGLASEELPNFEQALVMVVK